MQLSDHNQTAGMLGGTFLCRRLFKGTYCFNSYFLLYGSMRRITMNGVDSTSNDGRVSSRRSLSQPLTIHAEGDHVK